MYCALRDWQIIPGVDQSCRTTIIDRGNESSDDRSLARVSIYSRAIQVKKEIVGK